MAIQSSPQNNLPSINRFIAGLVTNRNPLDTPFSIVGLNIVSHHDALFGGLNMELSAYNTLIRRPGYLPFLSLSGGQTAHDAFTYTDLSGSLNLFFDSGNALTQNDTLVKTNSAGAGAWTLVGAGNFVYASNGVDQIRINNNALTTPQPWGVKPYKLPPQVKFASQQKFVGVSGFIPVADPVYGIIVVTDADNDRIYSYTINATAVHFNILFTGNVISQNLSYTQIVDQTQTGTPPNTDTTDVVTQTSGYTSTVTGTGITNGVFNYYPNTGVSSVDFDYAYTGTLTMSALVTILNASWTIGGGSGAPSSATAPLDLGSIVLFSVVDGQVPASLGAYPSVHANALGVIGLQTFGGQTIFGGTITVALQVNSGLYDNNNPQYSLEMQIGISPRFYRYVSPLVLVTDTFSGSFNLTLWTGSSTSATISFSGATLTQIAAAITAATIGWSTPPNAYVITLGQTQFLQIDSGLIAATFINQDIVLSMNSVSVTDLADTNLDFQFTPLSTNSSGLEPQQQYQWAYAVRETVSGALGNLSPFTTLGQQNAPGYALITMPSIPTQLAANYAVEVYRTEDGGSTFFLAGIAPWDIIGSKYSFIDIFPDSFLNTNLIGPINESNDPPPIGLFGITAHQGRLWGIVGNKVYYAGGPDTVNGDGNQAWPPANYFQFPGNVQKIESTEWGLVVALRDDLHIIQGVDASSFYPKKWLRTYGISFPNAMTLDGDVLYVYTTRQQLFEITRSSMNEIGFPIGDILRASFPSSTTNLTIHHGTSLDEALYISNGTNMVARYDKRGKSWSPIAQPLMGAGRVKSLETAIGTIQLLNGTGAAWYARDSTYTTFLDNSVAYTANAIIGIMEVAPSGSWTPFDNVTVQLRARGTLPTLSLLNNEISGPFTQLFYPVPDPPDLYTVLNPGPLTLWAYRWYLKSSQVPLPMKVNTIQVQLTFATENAQNEVLGMVLNEKSRY